MPIDTCLTQALKCADPDAHYWVAFSGGLDSTVLLHAIVEQLGPEKVSAIHVNHQLHPESDRWSLACQQHCDALGVPLIVHAVDVTAGSNLEERARDARYAIFKAVVRDNDCLVTAHHLNDQIEHFFLKLIKGGGPASLSGMPLVRVLDELTIVRPFLSLSKKELESYAQIHQLKWCFDSSNDDAKLDRNWMRHTLIPPLTERFNGVTHSISLAQEKCRVDADCATILAELDGARQDRLSLVAWRKLSPARQLNLLSHWIRRHAKKVPTWRALKELQRQCLIQSNAAQCIIAGKNIQRWKETLYCLPLTFPPAPQGHSWNGVDPIQIGGDLYQLSFQSTATPDAFTIYYWGQPMPEDLSPSKHHLKNRFQILGVPPWQRGYIPLIFQGKKMVVSLEDLLKIPFSWEGDS
jgi:tRNA(Ile)-lysidine synthase